MATRYKKLDDGRIQLFVSYGTGRDRKQRSKIIPGIKGRKRDKNRIIEELLVEFEKELIKKEKTSRIPTLDEYIEQWFLVHKSDLARTTYDSYKSRYTNHLQNVFGHKPLNKIDPFELAKLKTDKLKTLTPRTVKDIIDFLQMILNDAASNDVIVKNPVQKIKSPIVPKKEKKVFSEEDLSTVVAYIMDEPLIRQCVLLLALFSGLRRSEIVGLNKSSIIAKTNEIVVSRAYVRTTDGPVLKETKSNRVRKVVAPPFVTEKILLLEDKNELQLTWIEEEHKDALFIQPDGKRIYPSTPTLWWRNFLKKHKDLDHVTLHGLRHTYASLLISNDMDLVTVSRMIGHSKTSTTTDIYGHMMKNKKEEVLDIIDSVLVKNEPKMQNKCKIVDL